MGRPKGGKNKYWSKEEKLKLVKEHLEQHVSTLEITTRENISNGMYNNWLKNSNQIRLLYNKERKTRVFITLVLFYLKGILY